MRAGPSPRGPRTTTILVGMVAGVVSIILCCCILLFLYRYRSAMVQNARTSSAQAVSQVSNTVGNYLRDMEQAMGLVELSMEAGPDRRDGLLFTFLKFRPDVAAVTSYSPAGELLECWSLGREPREHMLQNLSFDLQRARSADAPYMTPPHVVTMFEGWYPWVVTMTEPVPQPGGGAAWVSLDLSFSNISGYINNVSIGQRGYCFLMDRAGDIVYHPQQQLLYAGLKAEDTAALAALEDGSYADDTVIYSLTSVADSDWRVVGVSYVDELVNRNVREMLGLSLGLAILVLAAALLTSWLLSQLLSRPLRDLSAAMEDFERDAGGFTYRPSGGHPGGPGALQLLRPYGPADSAAHDHRPSGGGQAAQNRAEGPASPDKPPLFIQHPGLHRLDVRAGPQYRRGEHGPRSGAALPYQHQPGPRAHTHRQGA